jgi:hypothetical protein
MSDALARLLAGMPYIVTCCVVTGLEALAVMWLMSFLIRARMPPGRRLAWATLCGSAMLFVIVVTSRLLAARMP